MKNLAKTVRWIGPSKKDLRALPKAIRQDVGLSLWDVQRGRTPLDAKVLHGFAGASVLEIRADYLGNTYRAVYTVRFGEFVYVLHVFQKKSKKGSKTPANIIELIRQRLKKAEKDYEEWQATEGNPN